MNLLMYRSPQNLFVTYESQRYINVCVRAWINAALIVPNESDTVALGRNLEIQIPNSFSIYSSLLCTSARD